MPLNIPIIRRMQQQFLDDPESLNMNSWCQCFAHWAIAFSGQSEAVTDSDPTKEQIACRILGLHPDRSENVFHAIFWPRPFALDYSVASNEYDGSHAIVAIEFLNHMVEHAQEWGAQENEEDDVAGVVIEEQELQLVCA